MAKLSKITDEQLLERVKTSSSIRNLSISLGLKGGSGFAAVKKRLQSLDVDLSHFTGKLWNKGLQCVPTNDIFCKNSSYTSGKLKTYAIERGLLKEVCTICNITQWNNKPLVLELDHINGLTSDNRIENLRLLCPNCHSQTPTFRGRNKNSGVCKVSDEELLRSCLQEKNIATALRKLGLTGAGNYGRCYRLLSKHKFLP